jgi:hypothetical protein
VSINYDVFSLLHSCYVFISLGVNCVKLGNIWLNTEDVATYIIKSTFITIFAPCQKDKHNECQCITAAGKCNCSILVVVSLLVLEIKMSKDISYSFCTPS